ncbi:hypothetical protein Vretifemale_2605, partial [Volvox reticuliferus]
SANAGAATAAAAAAVGQYGTNRPIRRSLDERPEVAARPFPVAVPTDLTGSPRQMYGIMLAVESEAMAATVASGGSIGSGPSGEADTGLEVRETAVAEAAAAAAGSGLLDLAAAEALRLRLQLESTRREVWVLRNRLAAADAEAAAQRQAQLEGVSSVLDDHGQIVSQLRAELNRMRLRNQGAPLLERLMRTERDLAVTGGT